MLQVMKDVHKWEAEVTEVQLQEPMDLAVWEVVVDPMQLGQQEDQEDQEQYPDKLEQQAEAEMEEQLKMTKAPEEVVAVMVLTQGLVNMVLAVVGQEQAVLEEEVPEERAVAVVVKNAYPVQVAEVVDIEEVAEVLRNRVVEVVAAAAAAVEVIIP